MAWGRGVAEDLSFSRGCRYAATLAARCSFVFQFREMARLGPGIAGRGQRAERLHGLQRRRGGRGSAAPVPVQPQLAGRAARDPSRDSPYSPPRRLREPSATASTDQHVTPFTPPVKTSQSQDRSDHIIIPRELSVRRAPCSSRVLVVCRRVCQCVQCGISDADDHGFITNTAAACCVRRATGRHR